MSNRLKAINVAMGRCPADILLINGCIVNVLSGEIMESGLVTAGELIAGVGDYRQGEHVIDLKGAYVLPGLIDSHVHIESSLMTPAAFAAAVIARGTTALVADPHEIVNIGGLAAWEYMVDSSSGLPVDIFYTVPSCVPATHMETAGASIGASEVAAAFEYFPQSPALAEMMNYPGVLAGDPAVLGILEQALEMGKLLDGHAPVLTDTKALNAYIGAGVRSDHECTTLEEAREKMRRGMHIMIREGSAARNLSDLLPLVNECNRECFSFCCDDRHAADILAEGHMDSILRKAVALDMPPIQAIRMATVNPARHFRLADRGVLAPGYRADMVIVKDLHDFAVEYVLKNGRVVYTAGDEPPVHESRPVQTMLNRVILPDFKDRLYCCPPENAVRARVIELFPRQVLTRALVVRLEELAGLDICRLAVIERHGRNGNIGTGLVKGLGLRSGALASTVAHDSHNLIIAGCDSESMEKAASVIADMGGGLAVTEGNSVLAAMPLPIGGLMSMKRAHEVAADYQGVELAARSLGCQLPAPFLTLSFLALPVMPELRLSDCGLVDVARFKLVSPWIYE